MDRPSGQAIPLQVDTLWDERHKAIEQKEKDRLAEEQAHSAIPPRPCFPAVFTVAL